ncbi:hypothetical protein, partial [Novosphingobium sp.]|uniref:hypothetical protein n=1 Tax=Novosphingobium sp. TaxID=1874826 RepID=UPI0028A6EB7B
MAQGFGEDALVGSACRRLLHRAVPVSTAEAAAEVVVCGGQGHRWAEGANDYGTGAIPSGGKANCHGKLRLF